MNHVDVWSESIPSRQDSQKQRPQMCAGLTTEKRLGGLIEADGAVQRGNGSHRAGQVPVVASWEFL